MDSILPDDVLSELARGRLARHRTRTRHMVVSGKRRHAVMKLTGQGFVIEADDLPHLRGYVDILCDNERIARRLAQFAWARDGLVGYEFKLDAGAREAVADYVKPDAPALLAAPERRRA